MAGEAREHQVAAGDPTCPLRPGEECHLCHPGSSGPQNCGLVYLVMTDPDLRRDLALLWLEQDED